MVGENKRLRRFWALIDFDFDDLGDDIARALDDDGVTFAYIFALNLVFVVKCGA